MVQMGLVLALSSLEKVKATNEQELIDGISRFWLTVNVHKCYVTLDI